MCSIGSREENQKDAKRPSAKGLVRYRITEETVTEEVGCSSQKIMKVAHKFLYLGSLMQEHLTPSLINKKERKKESKVERGGRAQSLIIIIENSRGIIMVICTIVAFSMGVVLTGIVLLTPNCVHGC